MSASENAEVIQDLINRGNGLAAEFDRSSELKDLDHAIDSYTKAVALTSEPGLLRSIALLSLAQSLMLRFQYHGMIDDIDKVISCYTKAVNTSPKDTLAPMLNDLGVAYASRFKQSYQLEDIERALSFEVQAIYHAPQNSSYLPALFNELGISLSYRFERLKNVEDIDHAVMCQKQSLIGTQSHVDRPKWLMNLGRALRDRFAHLNRDKDILESIWYLRQAVELTPSAQCAIKAMRLNNLASALKDQFDHGGRLADLDETITIGNEALLFAPDNHPEKAKCLNNLGYLLQIRFERLGDLADINQAILLQEKAALLSPDIGSPEPGWCNNLGNSLTCRFERLGDLSDLNRAISLMENAAAIMHPSHVLNSRWLSNLGSALLQRYEVQGKQEDINASINYLERAISLSVDQSTHKAGWFANLGSAYMSRFLRFEKESDLDNAIRHRSYAVSLIPEGHINKFKMLDHLGESHRCRFLRFSTPSDFMISLWAFHAAALLPSSQPYIRFTAALKCARLSGWIDKRFSLKHYEIAMNLLPQVVWMGTTIHRRYENISSIGSAITEGAARAIESQEYELALEWLDQGRSIVWRRTLSLRTPFDDLSQVNSSLASRFKEVARQLDHKGTSKPTISDHQNDSLDPEQEAQTHRRLAEKWEQILDEVRRIPGFDSFMRPRRSLELLKAARSSAVIVISVHELQCDALILRPNSQDVMHVPLPDFSHKKATAAYNRLTRSLKRKGIRERGFQTKQIQQADEFGGVLSLLWLDVVRPVLESLGYLQSTPTSDLPHITWCTTGPLALLPIHAAGCYSKPDAQVYNYVISSYTPTLSALLSLSGSSDEFQGILAVGQTNTPGLPALPGTTQELSCIEQQARNARYTQLDEQGATVDVVLGAIEQHSWIHFACHASQNASDPTASAFHLHDGPLSLTNIMQKSFKHAELASLPACQTAKGDVDLPDEAVHLAAGMLMAGFPSVIATIWSIRDEDAPLIAEEVYSQLLEGGRPDSRRAAKALHMAVERLREKVGEKAFTSWVPYVHLGIYWIVSLKKFHVY